MYQVTMLKYLFPFSVNQCSIFAFSNLFIIQECFLIDLKGTISIAFQMVLKVGDIAQWGAVGIPKRTPRGKWVAGTADGSLLSCLYACLR